MFILETADYKLLLIFLRKGLQTKKNEFFPLLMSCMLASVLSDFNKTNN